VVLPAGQTANYTFTNIQLNQIPDLIIICARYPMAQQNWTNSSSFLSIKGISINFNNQSGILASAQSSQLFLLSQKNGSQQSFFEYLGYGNANVNYNANANNGAVAGKGQLIPSLGSLLVLNPAMDFGLNSMYSSSSAGQFNFQFTLQVYNQTAINFAPEICVLLVNSGVFITENGTSSTQTGLLTREMVLQTKADKPVDLDRSYYKRLIGGNLSNVKQLGHIFKGSKSVENDAEMNKEHVPESASASGMSASGLHRKERMRLHRFVKK
jgi:hypothetical protein